MLSFKKTPFDTQAYKYVYEQILTSSLYDCKFFSTFEEFELFCEKDFSNKTGLAKLFSQPEIQLANEIVNKLREYYLTYDKQTCKPNEPITYFKCVYRR